MKNKFFKFIVSFYNGLVKKIFGNKYKEFIPINYHDKNIISKKDLKKQFEMTMEEILKLDIQKNFKKHPNYFNCELFKKIITDIKENAPNFLFLFEIPLYEFYLEIFINGNRKELENNYNLSKKALLLDETILSLKKTKEYKEKFKDTAKKLIDFCEISYDINKTIFNDKPSDNYENMNESDSNFSFDQHFFNDDDIFLSKKTKRDDIFF